ncbi:ribosome maturation protein RimP [Allosphingosinicella indica]|uniref:Ribosome maturation factor RimP n=1 Tax=Allosphingosinicella indica TaxID=941907 RepID=A0A1X7FZW0_9SPHN|nr:ribosome maturation protein RimP [Allosphingosinicella indica]SMF61619.1 ribosome maturation factor RimP [Allosphingosinicella indica]
MADIAALTRLIEPEAKALGFDLVRVMMIGGKDDPTLQVMAERPDTRQLDLADCEALSRRLSEIFDEADPIEEAYRLEVSSPGIDRPLTRPKDFEDWKGFEARLNLAEKLEGRKQYSGMLQGLAGEDVLIDVDGLGERKVPIASLHSAKLLFTDKLLAATAPLSADGADEFEQTEEEGQD